MDRFFLMAVSLTVRKRMEQSTDSLKGPEEISAGKKRPLKVLRVPRMERCIGCHSCSLACARLVHKQLSWDTAGIRIISSGGLSTGFEAIVCLACDPAPCAAACPSGALTDRVGGGVILKRRTCIRCGDCAKACPVGAIYISQDGSPYVCIHCGRCVDYCPHDCLELGLPEADLP